VAIVRLPDWSYFVSTFTDPAEQLPMPAPTNGPPGNPNARQLQEGPDVLDLVAMSPDASRFAVVNNPRGDQFTIDLLPIMPGRPAAALRPVRALGPFPGPCREVLYASGGYLVILAGAWKASEDWTIAVIDTEKNEFVHSARIPPPAFCVSRYMLSLSADATRVAFPVRTSLKMNAREDKIRVWDLAAGREVRSLPFSKAVYGTGHGFTPDGKKLVTAAGGRYVQVWDIETGQGTAQSSALTSQESQSGIQAVAVSPDSKRIATVRADGRLDVWDSATGRALVTPFAALEKPIESVVISPDGRLAATLGSNCSVGVWQLATGQLEWQIQPSQDGETTARTWIRPGVAFTPDGQGVLYRRFDGLAMANVKTGGPLDLPARLRGLRADVLEFDADGKTLATYRDNTVTLWNWPSAAERAVVRLSQDGRPEATLRSVSLSPDGRLLFTNSLQRALENVDEVWDAQTGKHLRRLGPAGQGYKRGVFSADASRLYVAGRGAGDSGVLRRLYDTIAVWDPAVGTVIRRSSAERADPRAKSDILRAVIERRQEHMAFIIGVPAAVSSDGSLLALADTSASPSGNIGLYETVSGQPVKELSGHPFWITCLAFSPDGRRLVSASADQTGLVWDVTVPALGGHADAKPADAWDRLAATDAGTAYAGIAALVARPTDAVPILRLHLRPPPVPTESDLDRIVAQLNADAFAVRQMATSELERFGPNAVAAAKVRLTRAQSAEVRDRLTRFLELYDGPDPSPYDLRSVRGVVALQAIGTTEARVLLAELAGGAPTAILTREAKAALSRLTRGAGLRERPTD
jgi:WD40 repeat protein